jgi:peptide/nickel transport system substrate-binding protein
MATELASSGDLNWLQQRSISRRQFLSTATAACALGVLAACSPSAPAAPAQQQAAAPTQPAAPNPTAAQAAPTIAQPGPTSVAPAQTVGVVAQPTQPTSNQANTAWAPAPVTFVYADSADVSHIDPALITDFWSFSVTRNTYDPLVEIDETRPALIPWLATSWDTSPDGTKHTFHLRDGVLFTDGSKLDADTVKLNLDRTLELKQGPAYLINNINDVTVADPMTVVITTQAPDPFVPAHLVKVGIASGQALKQHQTSSDPWAQDFFKDNIVGSGPYKLDSWQHGSQITLVKNDKWWNSWQPGSLDKIIIKVVAETAPRVQMIERGEVDFINQWPPAEALRIGKLPNFHLGEFNTFDTEPIFYMYTLKPPFDNKQLRQAMQYAFDYKAMIAYYQGHAVTPTGPIPPDYPGGSKDLQPFAQDLEQAKALIQRSGVDVSSLTIDFPLAGAGGDQFEAGATIMQDALNKLGMKMSIRKMPPAQWTELYAKPETAGNMTNLIQSPFTLDPVQFLAFYYPDNFFNMARFNNPAIVAALDKIKTTVDAKQRDTLLNDVQKQIRDEAPCVWGCRPKTLVAVPDYIDGYVMQATDYRWSMNFKTIRLKAH